MEAVQRISLREELGVSPDPDFHLTLPPGWARHEPNEALRKDWEKRAQQTLMQHHRPDLNRQIRSMIANAFQQMKQERVLAFFAPSDDDEDTLWLPLSLVATIRSGQGGVSLDDIVRHAIRNYKAEPLFGDMRILRFERERVQAVQGEKVNQIEIQYITPVPGSRRTRALQFFATMIRPDGVDAFAKHLVAARLLLDTCVASLQWVEDEKPQHRG